MLRSGSGALWCCTGEDCTVVTDVKKVESAQTGQRGVRRDTHTHSHITHINHFCRWVGNVTVLSCAQLKRLCLCGSGRFGSLLVSLSLSLPPSRFCAFSLAGSWSWGGWCAYSSVVHVQLSQSTCALYMCRRERCPTDTHFMQNTERVVGSYEEIGGGSTWTIGVAHRDSLFSANTDMPGMNLPNEQMPSLKATW